MRRSARVTRVATTAPQPPGLQLDSPLHIHLAHTLCLAVSSSVAVSGWRFGHLSGNLARVLDDFQVKLLPQLCPCILLASLRTVSMSISRPRVLHRLCHSISGATPMKPRRLMMRGTSRRWFLIPKIYPSGRARSRLTTNLSRFRRLHPPILVPTCQSIPQMQMLRAYKACPSFRSLSPPVQCQCQPRVTHRDLLQRFAHPWLPPGPLLIIDGVSIV